MKKAKYKQNDEVEIIWFGQTLYGTVVNIDPSKNEPTYKVTVNKDDRNYHYWIPENGNEVLKIIKLKTKK